MNHNSYKNQIRVNHRIRATEVRVIAENGTQTGVMSIGSALKMAHERGLDLVEVASDAKPPVCRVVDFGKYRYELAKKHKHDGKHAHASKLKELKFHVNIGEHDYSIKLKHATGFLQKGMRVKMSLFFRGREMAHQAYGIQLMNRIMNDMVEHGHSDAPPRLLGKNLHVILVPGKAKSKMVVDEPKAPSAAPSARVATDASARSFGTPIKIELKTTGA